MAGKSLRLISLIMIYLYYIELHFYFHQTVNKHYKKNLPAKHVALHLNGQSVHNVDLVLLSVGVAATTIETFS
jgi:hypothetical protein